MMTVSYSHLGLNHFKDAEFCLNWDAFLAKGWSSEEFLHECGKPNTYKPY